MFEETSLVVQVERLLFTQACLPGDCYDHAHTYLCRAEAGVEPPDLRVWAHPVKDATIREMRWFDLRDPGGWLRLVTSDRITCPWLRQVRAALG